MGVQSASARRDKYRQCARKVQYGGEAQAWRIAYLARHRTGESIGAYLCPWCKWWHIGHKLTDKRTVGRKNWQLEFIQKWRTSGEAEMLEGMVELFRELMQRKALSVNGWKFKVGLSMLRSRLRDKRERGDERGGDERDGETGIRRTVRESGWGYKESKEKWYVAE